MIIRSRDDVPGVLWGNGTSHRLLIAADGVGYTVTDTIVWAGTSSPLQYRNHLESCYCISGTGAVVDMDGVRHDIVPGTIYSLNQHDAHHLIADPEGDMRLICMFTPALIGDESHTKSDSELAFSAY
jgi:L-ectoine synthase